MVQWARWRDQPGCCLQYNQMFSHIIQGRLEQITQDRKQIRPTINGSELQWSISRFSCNLTRNATSHSMENLAFHSLLGWKMLILPILTTSLIHFSLKCWENVRFELGSERWTTEPPVNDNPAKRFKAAERVYNCLFITIAPMPSGRQCVESQRTCNQLAKIGPLKRKSFLSKQQCYGAWLSGRLTKEICIFWPINAANNGWIKSVLPSVCRIVRTGRRLVISAALAKLGFMYSTYASEAFHTEQCIPAFIGTITSCVQL